MFYFFIFIALIGSVFKPTVSELEENVNNGITERKQCFRILGGRTRKEDCCDEAPSAPCKYFCSNGFRCAVRWPNCTNPGGLGCSGQPESLCTKICPENVSCNKGCYEVYDSYNCKSCYCNTNFQSPCLFTKCNNVTFCALRRDCYNPDEDSCPQPTWECKQKCSVVTTQCPKGCLKYLDDNYCEQCYCCNNCLNHHCEKNEECVLEEIICKKNPCRFPAKCVEEKKNQAAENK